MYEYGFIINYLKGGINMNQNKMQLISKIFNNETIRTIWDKDEEKYYISVVDVVGVLSGSNRPRKYWSDLKKQLVVEGSKMSEKIGQLKLKSSDGKYYNTDVVDIEGMFRIIESVPSKTAEPIKEWLANLGSERIDGTFDPSLSVQRAIDLYRLKGYDEAWIAKRIKNLQDRKQLTDIWKENGVNNNIEFAILTNQIYKSWSGMTAKEYKKHKGLRKESLRDNMDDMELILTDLGEEATKLMIKKHKPQGLNEKIKIANRGGNIAKITRDNLEKDLNESVVKKNNKLNYKYKDEKLIK